MIWNFVIIGAVILALLIIIRKIPLARDMQQKENPDLSEKEMTTFGLIAQADDAFDRKAFEDAEELYVKAAAQDPDNDKIYNRLGAIYLENENFYDAKEAFLQTVKLDDTNASHHVNLGLAYMGLKDYYKAEQAFRDALDLDPKNKKYQNLLEKSQKPHGATRSQDKDKKKR